MLDVLIRFICNREEHKDEPCWTARHEGEYLNYVREFNNGTFVFPAWDVEHAYKFTQAEYERWAKDSSLVWERIKQNGKTNNYKLLKLLTIGKRTKVCYLGKTLVNGIVDKNLRKVLLLLPSEALNRRYSGVSDVIIANIDLLASDYTEKCYWYEVAFEYYI